MTTSQRRYRETHDGIDDPLDYIARYIESHGRPDADDIHELSRAIALPESSVVALVTSYADFTDPPDERLQRCTGTSCHLSGGSEEVYPAARSVYCLGYCDRSPAVMHRDGMLVGDAATSALVADADPRHADPLPAIHTLTSTPIVLQRLSNGDHGDLARARNAGVYTALALALQQSPETVLRSVEESGLRGRGGAGFPTGTKWRRCAEVPSSEKYVVVNGDEGDPGSFVDRVLMESDPHAVLEGLIISAYAIGARAGIVFIRSEYPRAIERMQLAIHEARDSGLLGRGVLRSGFDFDVTISRGHGSYVCGEETALLNAIEGLRGEVRIRPPYPTTSGLYGKPTVVNNVETLVSVPWIMTNGAREYAALGTAKSKGTKVMCLNASFERAGLVEVEFGFSLRDLLQWAKPHRKLDGINLGGPMGSILFDDESDLPICYGAMGARGIQLGHGGIVGIPAGTNYRRLLLHWLEFMKDESCGRCVPCRLGSRAAWEAFSRDSESSGAQLDELFDLMENASLCAFGQSMPAPMRKLLQRIRQEAAA